MDLSHRYTDFLKSFLYPSVTKINVRGSMPWIIITAVFVSFLPEELESHYVLLGFKAPTSWWVGWINWSEGSAYKKKSRLLCAVHWGFDSHFFRLRKVLSSQLPTQLPGGRTDLKYFSISACCLCCPCLGLPFPPLPSFLSPSLLPSPFICHPSSLATLPLHVYDSLISL